MPDILSIALSGLTAQQQRLGASANNIANATTSGPVPTATQTSTVYRPLDVSFTALTSGGSPAGVRAEAVPDENGYTVTFDPSHPYANSEGFIAAPNVDLTKEYVNIIESKALFKANLAVIKTEKEMMGELLDSVT